MFESDNCCTKSHLQVVCINVMATFQNGPTRTITNQVFLKDGVVKLRARSMYLAFTNNVCMTRGPPELKLRRHCHHTPSRRLHCLIYFRVEHAPGVLNSHIGQRRCNSRRREKWAILSSSRHLTTPEGSGGGYALSPGMNLRLGRPSSCPFSFCSS